MGPFDKPRRAFVIHLFAGLAASTACRRDAATNASSANPDVAPAIVPARGADATDAAHEAARGAMQGRDVGVAPGAISTDAAASDADAQRRADASNDGAVGAEFGIAGTGPGVGNGSRMGGGTIGLGNIGTIGGSGGRMGSGTIGLGNIGTVGGSGGRMGGGTSSGYGHSGGGMAAPGMRVPSPRIRPATPTVSGMMSPEVIRRVVLRNFGQLRACYEPALAQNPQLAGRVVIHFVIGPAGAVTDASVAQSPPPLAPVAACIATAFHRIVFPAPESGSIIVNYPMQLDPAPN